MPTDPRLLWPYQEIHPWTVNGGTLSDQSRLWLNALRFRVNALTPGAPFTASGDLSGTNVSQTVIGLQNRHLSATAPADGQVLTWSSTNNDWEPKPIAAGVPPTRTINTTAPLTGGGDLSIDRTFAVSLATTSTVGVVKPDGTTITIDGTGKISTAIPAWLRETPSGTMNGSNVTFTLSHTPLANSLTLYLNGVEQISGTNYSIVGSTITYTVAPKATDLMLAQYAY